MCWIMGKKLTVFQKNWLSIHSFFKKKMQKYAFQIKKNGFELNFISNLSAVGNKPGLPVSKNTKHLKFWLKGFLRIF